MKYKSPRIKKTDPIESPCKKTIYTSLSEATESIEYLQADRWVKKLSAYKCPVCGFWHLTKS